MTDEKLRLGGMALRNGLLVHGPTHWAAAVRREDGTIAVGSGRKPRLRVADGVAGVRGVLRLAEAVVVLPLVKKGLPEARLPWQDAKVIGAIVAASAGGQIVRRVGAGRAGAEAMLAAHLGRAERRRPARRPGRRVARRRAQVDRRLRDRRRGRGRREGARPLRVASHGADARRQPRGHRAAAARDVDAEPGRAGRGRARVAGRRGRGVRLVGAQPGHARPRSCCAAPATSCSGCSGTREPTEDQLEVGRAALDEIVRAERSAS